MSTIKLLVTGLTVLLSVLLTSCVLESRHPASDEKTSKIDERLIGTWVTCYEGDCDKDWFCRVRRRAGKENTLEVTFSDPNAPGTTLMFTTTIKSKHYISVAKEGASKGNEGATSYEINQYEVLDKDHVKVLWLDSKVIERAIERKELAGEFKVEKMEPAVLPVPEKSVKDEEEREPLVTATTKDLVRYLENHAAECFPGKKEDKDFMIFKRIAEKPAIKK